MSKHDFVFAEFWKIRATLEYGHFRNPGIPLHIVNQRQYYDIFFRFIYQKGESLSEV